MSRMMELNTLPLPFMAINMGIKYNTLIQSPINVLGPITCLSTLNEVLHKPTKTYKLTTWLE